MYVTNIRREHFRILSISLKVYNSTWHKRNLLILNRYFFICEVNLFSSIKEIYSKKKKKRITMVGSSNPCVVSNKNNPYPSEAYDPHIPNKGSI